MPGALHSIDMGQAQRTTSTDSADALRKRVCKACDRCRLKKSKCDGASPCSRCKTDNAICVFGERKKSHDKVYPKGYVEMLEQQQGQLVSGLQELYHRMYKGERWPGSKLSESNGHPLTHDILAALGLLEPKADGSGEMEVFEEDTEKIQSRLLAEGAGYVRRRGSFSSDSEHSQHSHNKRHSHGTPSVSRQPTFDRNFSFTASPSPVTQSPAPRQRVSYPTAQDSPLHRGQDLNNNLSLFQPEWSAQTFMDTGSSKFMRPEYAMRTSQPDQSLDMTTMDFLNGGNWGEQVCPLDLSMDVGMYQQQLAANQYTSGVDFNTMQMDLDSDFKQFIQVTS